MPVFPASGSLPWQNSNELYVSPDGSDSNTGNSWQAPKRTIYSGLSALISAGGGTLYFADDSSVGGPVSGQGIWLRGDGMSVSGFLPITCPIKVVGCGRRTGGVFVPDVTAKMNGGGSRLAPRIWISFSDAWPVTFQNILGFEAESGVKCGADFDRFVGGAARFLTVTNATRTSSTTVYTVDVNGTVPFTVNSATRSSNVTTLTIPNPGLTWPPFGVGSVIRFASDHSGTFPDGDYTITAMTGHRGGLSQPSWTVSYADVGANVGATSVAGTVKSHGLRPADMLELQSNDNTKFLSVSYLVSSVTIDTITVPDVFNTSGNQNVNNIGTLLRQERLLVGTTTVEFTRVCPRLDQSDNKSGPSWDIGNTAAIPPRLRNCYMEGYIGPVLDPTHRDPMRMASLLAYSPGSINDNAACGFTIEDSSGTSGSIYGQTSATGLFVVRRTTIDIPVSMQTLALPAVEIHGTSFTGVLLEDVQNADAQGGTPPVKVFSVPPNGVQIIRCGPGIPVGAGTGGDQWWTPSIWGAGTNSPTPWQSNQVTTWADGRFTGKIPGPARTLAPAIARFKNIALINGDQRGNVVTANTTDVFSPSGKHDAFKLVSAGDYYSIFPQGTDGNAWHVGGLFFVSGWIYATDDLAISSELFRVNTGHITFVEDPNGVVRAPYNGTGWQYISGYLTVQTVDSSTPAFEVEMLFPAGKTVYLFGITCYYVDSGSSIDPNDAYEHVGSAVAYPSYLPAGIAGSMEGIKLVGHGGLGTAARYTVGGSSGQITIGSAAAQAIEVFDESGNSLGVLRPSAFTVN